MYFYEEKTIQGYRLFQSFRSANTIAKRMVEEPFPVIVTKSIIIDEENGSYHAELQLHQFSPKDSKKSEQILIILSDFSFSDLQKHKKLLHLISKKSMYKFKNEITTMTEQNDKMMRNLEDIFT